MYRGSRLATVAIFTLLSFAAAHEARGQEVHPGADPARSVGGANAPVTVEVFNDYQCPSCAAFHRGLKRIMDEHKRDVRVVFRNYPLTSIHKNAQAAATAAEAAGLQGKFVEMINLLYENQAEWGNAGDARRLFLTYARRLELGLDRFHADMNGSRALERVLLDTKRALSLDLKGTPSVLVNGRDAGFTYKTVSRAVKEAQAAASKAAA